jgi:hypothetical protein
MTSQNIDFLIISKISKAKRGALFFIENFLSFGTAKSVGKALQRLTDNQVLMRVATGIYCKPAIDPMIGPLTPTVEEIARAIAKRDKARIAPTGDYAMHRLGLSTQMPLNIVYYTDGSARKIQVKNFMITFKKTSPKNLSTYGEISSLAIQALKSIGKENVSEEEISKIQSLLRKEQHTHLLHDYKIAPDWIRHIFLPVLKEIK